MHRGNRRLASVLLVVASVITVAGITVTAIDLAGITVTPTSGLITTEAGGTDTFTVVLDSAPTAEVSIGILSANLTEGIALPVTLSFTSANWDIPQTVTVTGVNDGNDDGDIGYTVLTSPAVSADQTYLGIDPSDVGVTNTDDDTLGITVTPTSGLVTTEAGGTDTFTVVLDSAPTAEVLIGILSADPTEGIALPFALLFTSANWDTPQTVTVTGVNDGNNDGDIGYTVLTSPAVSTDLTYLGVDPSNVGVTNIDDDIIESRPLVVILTGYAGSFLDSVLLLAEGEEPPMIGLQPLAAVHAVGDIITGSCQILRPPGPPTCAGFVHIYLYSVDISTTPETLMLLDHWMANYNWPTAEYQMAWDTSGLAPGYYQVHLFFADESTLDYRIELTPPVE